MSNKECDESISYFTGIDEQIWSNDQNKNESIDDAIEFSTKKSGRKSLFGSPSEFTLFTLSHASNSFADHPLKHLIRECDKRPRNVRELINNENRITNIKCYGSYNVTRTGEIQSRAVNEVIRIVDAREEERKYVEKVRAQRRFYRHRIKKCI